MVRRSNDIEKNLESEKCEKTDERDMYEYCVKVYFMYCIHVHVHVQVKVLSITYNTLTIPRIDWIKTTVTLQVASSEISCIITITVHVYFHFSCGMNLQSTLVLNA